MAVTWLVLLIISCCKSVATLESSEGDATITLLGTYQETTAVLRCGPLPCVDGSQLEYYWISPEGKQSQRLQWQIPTTSSRIVLLDVKENLTPNGKLCISMDGGQVQCKYANDSIDIPAPRNLVILSANFNHTLTWGYEWEAEEDIFFQVEYQDLTLGEYWYVVPSCHPTASTGCHVFEPIHFMDDGCPVLTNEGEFAFRVRACLGTTTDECSAWSKGNSTLLLPDTIKPPDFKIVGLFGGNQLRILNKPYVVYPVNVSLNCFYTNSLSYLIRYGSSNDTDQIPPRERKASFDMTLITLELLATPRSNTSMCVQMRIVDDVNIYESEWRAVCKTVQTEPVVDEPEPLRERFFAILFPTLLAGAILVACLVYKARNVYRFYFRRDLKLPEKLVEILKEFERSTNDDNFQAHLERSRSDQIPEQSDSLEMVEHLYPPLEVTDSVSQAYVDDQQSMTVEYSSPSEYEIGSSLPFLPNERQAQANEFLYIRNMTSEESSVGRFSGASSPSAGNANRVSVLADVHANNSDVYVTRKFSCCPENGGLSANESKESGLANSTSLLEYTVIEPETSNRLYERDCKTAATSSCGDHHAPHVTPSSSLDDVFLDERHVTKGRRDVTEVLQNPTYSPHVSPLQTATPTAINLATPTCYANSKPSLSPSANLDMNAGHSEEDTASKMMPPFMAGVTTIELSKTKRSSLYQKRISRRKRVHSYAYERIFASLNEEALNLESSHQHQWRRTHDAGSCRMKSGCCSRCCSRLVGSHYPEARNRSDSCKSADSGYPLDWSSFSDESPPASPSGIIGGQTFNQRLGCVSQRTHSCQVEEKIFSNSHVVEAQATSPFTQRYPAAKTAFTGCDLNLACSQVREEQRKEPDFEISGYLPLSSLEKVLGPNRKLSTSV